MFSTQTFSPTSQKEKLSTWLFQQKRLNISKPPSKIFGKLQVAFHPQAFLL